MILFTKYTKQMTYFHWPIVPFMHIYHFLVPSPRPSTSPPSHPMKVTTGGSPRVGDVKVISPKWKQWDSNPGLMTPTPVCRPDTCVLLEH